MATPGAHLALLIRKLYSSENAKQDRDHKYAHRAERQRVKPRGDGHGD
jgi:hypothetical protein